jgi:predicted O-methyltransferase YrrM
LQDAFSLYAMIRHWKPKKIIEVGCGASSCVILDTCEAFQPDTKISFIEPYPELLLRYIRPADQASSEIRKEFVQDVPLDVFASLEENDILFIDTSHVSKLGSDVNFIFFEILPLLRKGVILHFHDIFYPFEYPEEWIRTGTFWNEAYLLRAFLMYNRDFEILLFTGYLNQILPGEIKANFPLAAEDPGASLWLRRA